jgi:hypothetical protein
MIDEFHAPIEACRAALAMLIERELYHPALHRKHSILTSANIQKQFLEIKKAKKNIIELNPAFWLLDIPGGLSNVTIRWTDVAGKEVEFLPKKPLLLPENLEGIPELTEGIPENEEVIRQKKRKEKEKEKERKENIEIAGRREELSLEANPQEPEAVSVEPWMRATNPIARLVAHLEATRPIEELPGGIIRARSKQSEQGWLALFFQGYGEEKVHAAIAEVDSGGWYCTEKHIRAALKGEMASLYPSRGSRNRSSFRPKDDLHEKLSNPEEYYFQEDSK